MKSIAILSGVAFALVAPAASAVPIITFSAGSGTQTPGTTVFQNFDSYAVGSLLPGGFKAYAENTKTSLGAPPAFGSTGNFGSVVGGGNYSVSFAPTSIFSFVLGSLDTFNKLTLHFADSTSITYMGGAIIGGLPFVSGDQHNPLSNGVVAYYYNGGPLITGATFETRSNSFEFDNFARGGVPEPATWALMILGFGAIGGAMRRRRVAVAYS